MANWKARAQSLAKHSLTNAAGGAKGSALSLAVGFAVYHLWSFVNKQTWAPASPWVMPAGLAILGHFLKRKYPAVGVAMLGAVGFALATTLTMQALIKANGAQAAKAEARGLPVGFDAALIRDAQGLNPYDAALVREAVGLAASPRAPPTAPAPTTCSGAPPPRRSDLPPRKSPCPQSSRPPSRSSKPKPKPRNAMCRTSPTTTRSGLS